MEIRRERPLRGPYLYILLSTFFAGIMAAQFAQELTAGQEINKHIFLCTDSTYESLGKNELLSFIDSLKPAASLKPLEITEPLPNTLLPPNMASPAFIWKDTAQSSAWFLKISIKNTVIVSFLTTNYFWIPEAAAWDHVKKNTGTSPFEVTIMGIGGISGRDIVSKNCISLKFSNDPVNGRLMFMRKPLPFLKAKKNPEQTSLMAGEISSYHSPETIMSDPPICANCHSYSSNCDFMTIDTDYGGDKGAFIFSALKKEISLDKNTVFSWNTMAPQPPASYSMGLFSRVSPCGRFIAGTVNETSVFVMMNDLYFSQLFYPATGQIAFFDTRAKSFKLLPGASLPNRVQTAPAWSPDGETIAFSSVSTSPKLIQKVLAKEILNENPEQKIHSLNKKYPVQFDIYTIAFNRGKGGKAKPLKGASKNGCSNYFPRYSPDGKWIVFTQSPTGLVLQPDSKLVIVPSKGGEAKQLASNQAVMNSWHSWSPNSKWIAFTCKARSPYTELFLTHISEKGEASPAIRLFRFSSNELAAMVPEFIGNGKRKIADIRFKSTVDARGNSIAIDGR